MKSGADRPHQAGSAYRFADELAVARAYLDALGRDEPVAVTALVAETFRNEHHAALGSGCVSRDEYARRLPGFFATFSNRHYEVIETAAGSLVGDDAGGCEVIVNYRFHADVDGTRIDIPGVMWISVRADEVVRRLDSWDSLTFHRQTDTVPGRE